MFLELFVSKPNTLKAPSKTPPIVPPNPGVSVRTLSQFEPIGLKINGCLAYSRVSGSETSLKFLFTCTFLKPKPAGTLENCPS